MQFTNSSVAIDDLPRAANLELKPVEPQYLRVLMINRFILWSILLAAIVALCVWVPSWKQEWVRVAAGITWLAFVLVSWRLTLLSFRNKAYALREHDIIYRSGWLIQSVRICPFNRIQHCSIESGVFERRFGLASISVYTAGGTQADMKLPGIPQQLAASMRDYILSRTNNATGG